MNKKQIAVAVVGVGAIMPDANDADQFWQNILNKRVSIQEVPAERWQSEMFYHPDPSVPDKTYSKIGAWVKDYPFNPLGWGILIPPRVLENMDDGQKWAIAASRQALMDYGYPERPLDNQRVAVILGNAMAGEHHYQTNLRIHAPEFEKALSEIQAFQSLPQETQQLLLKGMLENIQSSTPPINEDTMPGELSNIIAGRVANVFNFSGPNFVTDAACASSLAALQAAIEGLASYQYDAVLTGGVDRNMGPGSFVKFSKIGALSPDGSRPYAAGANGFVMGEGAAVFLLKRLEDAEKDGDKIYAVVRGVGSSSDGKGKGITAPNPNGQQLAIQRAWENAGVNLASVGLIEGHGTSTRVGDRVETQSLTQVFGSVGLPTRSVGLGSVKSNIGHLKSAAGAAGLLKVFYALDKKILPPSANFIEPNPEIPFNDMPFFVVPEPQAWERPAGEIRRAGVSSFGFGGTNFHVVVEEYVPGISLEKQFSMATSSHQSETTQPELPQEVKLTTTEPTKQSKQLVFLGAETPQELHTQLTRILEDPNRSTLPENAKPQKSDLQKKERLVISYYNAEELIKKGEKALKGLANDQETPWQALAAQGIYRGSGRPGKVAFLFPGQGSQYTNMLRDLIDDFPIIRETYQEADQIMTPLLGKPLTDYIFIDNNDEESIAKAEEALKDTTITQPAVLTANIAIMRLLASHHIHPDMLIGHSLGEYAALVAASSLTFKEALEIVSARGHAMSALKVEDNGCMAAVLAPIEEVKRIISTIDDYVVLANVNSPVQSVIGGETTAVDKAIVLFKEAGLQAVKIPVSHAFHTRIVAPASDTLRRMIERTDIRPPQIPIAANVTGEIYPTERTAMIDMLSDHIASPVQFVQGVQTLYESGGRIYVEVGPKRVLNSLAKDILKEYDDTTIVATNHPRRGGIESIYEALCQLYALGLGYEKDHTETINIESTQTSQKAVTAAADAPKGLTNPQPISGSVVISGAGLGLPGRGKHVFSDDNIDLILKGNSFIEDLPETVRQDMLGKRVTRLEKSDSGARMVLLDDLDQTVKLAGQHGTFDLAEEFGIPADRVAALDITTQLAIAAGIEALRDAGIPLVMRYKKTSTGSFLPNRWMLPESLADETGVIFGSAFPGLDEISEEAERYYEHQRIASQIQELESLQSMVQPGNELIQTVLSERIAKLQEQLEALNYHFDRKFIFRVLTMGHAQFAEYIGARGPNTAVNAACATTTHALSIAEDWIRNGRCRRVVIVAGDDVTGGSLVSWVGTGLLASGATTTNGDLRTAALPFDRRRNGMIMGMGAAGLVVEAEDAVRERGMRGICEILATDTANSAFHGTRLDVGHVSQVMQRLVDTAERRFGIHRHNFAAKTMFMSHETYTPARGGSAAAEIKALRSTFGEHANQVLIANTKGFTGHTMAVGIEDIVSVKALETGQVPPIAHLDDNFEPDPDLGNLNLSRGGQNPIDFALRLGAGFGSQVAMALLRRIPGAGERILPGKYNDWLAAVAGYTSAELEVVQRTLRIKDQGIPVQSPSESSWVYGEGPTLWSDLPQDLPEIISAPAEPAAAAPEVQSQSRPTEEEIVSFVLNLVSEKTGYPPEILEMDLDLEADLGIDTVKQAELFAAVRQHFGIPRREDLMLVDYNTLQKVVGFVQESFPDGQEAQPAPEPAPQPAAPVQPAAAAPEPQSQSRPTEEEIVSFVLNLVSEKTGYPPEILEMDLDLEADLGIDTVKQAELFAAVRQHFGIPRREDLMLVDYNTLQKVVGFVQESFPDSQEAQQAVQPAPEPSPQPSAPVQPAAAAPEPQSQSRPTEEEIVSFVLNLVSEKTGYPPEILEMDLDLEADLGIDTVKQAELFAAVRQHFGIPRREDLMLVDYNTLQKVVGFVQESFPDGQEAQQEIVPQAANLEIEEKDETSTVTLEPAKDIQAILRRVPTPILRPKLDLCLPTGVELEAGKRVLVLEDDSNVGETLTNLLLSRNVSVLRAKLVQGSSLEAQIQSWITDGSIHGVYFLSSLNPERPLTQMTEAQWETNLNAKVYALYQTMRQMPAETFLIAATNTGGLHGYNQESMHSTGGGVSGFCKALAQERPDTLIKVIDFESSTAPDTIASQLLAETLRDPAVAEVGTEFGQRFGFSVREAEWRPDTSRTLKKDGVYLVTGGTGGIIPPVIQDLFTKTGGKFYLLGRSPLPSKDDPDYQIYQTAGAEGLKRTWMQAMLDGGERMTPVQMQSKIDRFSRAAATLDLMESIQNQGGTARYLVADITNYTEVDRIISMVLQEEGQIDTLIHAAGFEHSRKLESKPFDEFVQTMQVKTSSFFYLYKAMLAHHGLPQDIVLFSSIAGRYGNSGQTDYSAANDLLSKMAVTMNFQHPQLRVVTIDWGPWADMGMASRGNTPELMAMAGIEMMDPQSAARLVYKELTQGSGHEVVFAGDLGAMEQASDSKAGLDIEAANIALRSGDPIHVMLSSVTGYDQQNGMTFEVTLDPNQEPFLHDHALNGTPLLPGVMGIEGFTVAAQHIASVLGSNDRTSLRVSELEDIQFLTPFKFYRNEPRHIIWKAMPERSKDGLKVSIRLESINPSRLLQDQKPVLHFTGRVVLKTTYMANQALVAAPPKWNGRYTLTDDQIYKLYFHGPAFQVLEGVQKDKNGLLGKLSTKLPPFTSKPVWLDTNPVLIELCLQTAGIYEISKTGALSLPQSINKVRFYRHETNGVPIYAQVQAIQTEDGLQFNSRVIDEKGRIYLELTDYRTSTLPSNIDKPLLAPLAKLLLDEE